MLITSSIHLFSGPVKDPEDAEVRDAAKKHLGPGSFSCDGLRKMRREEATKINSANRFWVSKWIQHWFWGSYHFRPFLDICKTLEIHNLNDG